MFGYLSGGKLIKLEVIPRKGKVDSSESFKSLLWIYFDGKSLDNLHGGDSEGHGGRGLDAGNTDNSACLKDRVMTFNCGVITDNFLASIEASKCL